MSTSLNRFQVALWVLITALWVLITALCACTGKEPRYCDEQTPCDPGFRCDLELHTCLELTDEDGGIENDGSVDWGSWDMFLPDSGGLPNGETCSDPTQCQSELCVDVVCCDGTCDGICRSCALPDSVGACTLAPEGTDPHQNCIGVDPACNGSCSGQGTCTFPDSATSCGAPSCSDGELTTHHCDGSGRCQEEVQTCGGYVCTEAGDACKTTCIGTIDCTGTFQCINGTCVNQLPIGSACGSNNDACASKQCTDGVCCDTACTSPCQACDLAGSEGTCSNKPNGDSCGPTSCAAGTKTVQTCSGGTCSSSNTSCGLYQCNSQGDNCLTACGDHDDCVGTAYCAATLCATKKDNGATCADNVECTSNICQATEKVCCNTACNAGPCQSCKLSDKLGACSLKPSGTACGSAPSCVDEASTSYIETHQCNGTSAACQTLHSACDPYRCAGSGGAQCATSCTSHGGCTTGFCDLSYGFGSPETCPPASEICFADQAKTCPATGSGSAADPHCKIQDCIAMSRPYVAIANGTYNESLSLSQSMQLVSTGTSGPLMVNGFPQVNVAKVKLLAQGSDPAISISGSSTKIRVYGFDITRASTLGSSPLVGISSSGSDFLFETLNIHDCNVVGPGLYTTSSGANNIRLVDLAVTFCDTGVHTMNSNVTLSTVGIGTSATYGLNHSGGELDVEDSMIAFNPGTGLRASNSEVTMNATKIGGNGAGILLEDGSTGTILNTQINDNDNYGVSLSTYLSVFVFLNATIVNNGGPMIDCSDTLAGFFNSIVWSQNHSNTYTGNCTFEYSDVKISSGTVPGSGNKNANPQFNASHPLHPYSLLNTSPCVDAGNDAIWDASHPTEDLAGNPRKVDKISGGTLIDIGAFEVQ